MRKRPNITIGVLSHTHLPYRMSSLPSIIYNIFQGVDYIFHAGDVDKIDLLAPLREIAPLYAVRGNIHLHELSLGGIELPAEIRLKLANYTIVITHGHRPGLMGWLLKVPEVILSGLSDGHSRFINDRIARRLHKRYAEADVVIFGHTHVAYTRYLGRTLFFNPGGVVSVENRFPSVGLLHLWPDHIESQIVFLADREARIAQLKDWIAPPSTV